MPMSATSFDSRSSEWMGDLTVWLRQNASDNGEQLDRLRTKLRYARSAELTQRQQQLLRLYFEEGKTMPQIARELHVSCSTVSRTLRRARERLYRCLRYSFETGGKFLLWFWHKARIIEVNGIS